MDERLQKILAHAGVASRRAAEEMIVAGRVSVNGQVVRKMGVRADQLRDVIAVDGHRIPKAGKPIYVLLNKPRSVVSTLDDPEKRQTVVDLIRPKIHERVYPVGRLDFASEGLLILTNDGEFTRFMTRGGRVPKVYRVKVSGTPAEEELGRLRRGLRAGGIRYAACRIHLVKPGTNPWYEITLLQGRNRQIRRMIEAIGHRVLKLRRTRIGFLEDSRLEPGEWRLLQTSEIKKFYDRYSNQGAAQPGRSRPVGARKAKAPRAAKHKTKRRRL